MIASLSPLATRRLHLLNETIFANPLIPERCKDGLTLPQAQILTHEGREALYGGAAGGGKSFALLMAALQYADVPGYHALILRRTFKQLAKADSILNLSKEWLSGKVKWNGDAYRWTFPQGGTLEFGHMESEDAKYNYQGAAYRYVAYDELTQFTETMYTYLFSRQRRDADSQIPLRMRAASNPGGTGHAWVKKRFIDPRTRLRRAAFFPARLDDNPNIDRDSYTESLNELDPITRAQLLTGDWDAVAGGRFLASWFTRRFKRRGTHYLLGERIFEYPKVWRFQTVDAASTADEVARKNKADDPDYTVVSTWGVTPDFDLVWLDCRRFRKAIPDIVPAIQEAYDEWEPEYVGIEAVYGNSAVYQIACRTRMVVKQLSPGGKDKLVRATKAIVLASSGRIWLPEWAPWVDDAVAELTLFTGDEDKDAHDDVVDTMSYAANLLGARQSQERPKDDVPRVYPSR